MLRQTLVAEKGHGHEATVETVARAAVASWVLNHDNPVWQQWFDVDYGKTVRRVRVGKLGPILDVADTISGTTRIPVACFLPCTVAELPAIVRKAQVSGFDEPRGRGWSQEGVLDVYVNSDVAMSTGKTAAQVAHGLINFFKDDPQAAKKWLDHGAPMSVSETPHNQLPEGTRVVDNGLTEIPSGTTTVVVRAA